MKKYLFFDTETTGVPPAPFPAPSLWEEWPRMVQIAFLVCDEQGRRLKHYCEVIKPMGYTIPDNMIHGISHEEALRVGVPVRDALLALQKEASACNAVIAHNLDFDLGIVNAEAYRFAGVALFENCVCFCTQKQTTSTLRILKRPGQRGTATLKWPSLADLHSFCGFGEIPDAHDAMADATACARCFFWIKERYPAAFEEQYLPNPSA
jgi:DNA polymerase-3 subunit epsilon